MVRPIVARSLRFGIALAACAVSFGLSDVASVNGDEGKTVDFARQIQPILAKRCFKCHGPDAAEGGLRLDTADGMTALLDSGEPGLVAGEPEKSQILLRVREEDESLRMPVDDKPLSETEIGLIETWIREGGEWREHWSFRPLERPAVPTVADAAWVASPIDAFLRAGLERAELTPAPPASKIALIRRAYYDLIGLPPTPEEIDAFVADESPDAFEKVIDRLLESEHYGEKWGRHWLDLVRYAETNGYERDGRKDGIWKYRDYVIRSLNEDKPYDRFVLEQLAGDELPDRTPDSIIATGFHRLGIWDDEPADRELARFDYLDDLVKTTGETFLGLTVGCGRCHDHKIDPISQRDYYSMVAFFADISDHGAGTTNHVSLATEADEAAFRAKVDEKNALEERLRRRIGELEASWIAMVIERFPEEREGLEAAGASATDVDDSRRTAQTWRYTQRRPGDDWFAIGFDDSRWRTGPGGFGREGTPGAVVRTNWTSERIWLRRDFRLETIPSKVVLNLHHDEEVEIYLNGQRIFSRDGYAVDYAAFDITDATRPVLQTGKNVLAVSCRNTGGGQYVDVGLEFDGIDRIARIIAEHGDLLDPAEVDERHGALEQLAASEAMTLEFRPPTAMAVAEKGPQPMWILQRGLPAMKGDEVAPAFLEVLDPPSPSIEPPARGGTSGKRLALARWVVDPSNPLTARVMANRIWQYHFGRGIVRTTSDFGLQGMPPTHPELLDWLAVELIDGGWRLKPLHKKIMLSNAYRMSSEGNEQALQLDPQNDLYWRFDMRRLTAEELRDAILTATGAINLELFGPPVFPTLPDEVLATSSQPENAWGRSEAADETRRTIYVHVKRSLRPPMLAAFDAADTDGTCPVRMVTTVPTQALGMLNSDFMVEQADRFAERLAREAGDDPRARIERGIRLIAGRPANDAEVTADLDFLDSLRSERGLDERRVWQVYGLMLLKTNEFVYLD